MGYDDIFYKVSRNYVPKNKKELSEKNQIF